MRFAEECFLRWVGYQDSCPPRGKKLKTFFVKSPCCTTPEAEENYVIDKRGNEEEVVGKLHQGY